MGPGGQLNDTHKKWGVAIFVLYFFQLSLGGFIHFIKVRFLCVLGRSVQNYFHALFGIFLIGISFYQVRSHARCRRRGRRVLISYCRSARASA